MKPHIVQIHCPPDALGDDGQPRGKEGVLYRDVPCSIETLGGTEPIAGGQQQAITTYRIEMRGDPGRPIRHSDHLKFGQRTLSIQAIEDKHQNGCELVLICGERHA